MNQTLKVTTADPDGLDMLKDMVRLWRELGIAMDVAKTPGSKTRLLAPPEEQMVAAANELGEMFGFSPEDKSSILTKWKTRQISPSFDINKFKELKHVLGKLPDTADDGSETGAAVEGDAVVAGM